MSQEIFSVEQVANKLHVHRNTIYSAIKCGRIQAFRVGYGKKASFRILQSEIERMVAFDAKQMIDQIVETRIQSSAFKIDCNSNKSE